MEPTVKPERTAAIILGASHWPEYPTFGKSVNPVFANSAAAIREYLTDPIRFGLRPDRVLPLFDSPVPAPEIHRRIAEFLKPLSSESNSGGLTDLIVYYVGHGGFTGPDRRYFFAIQSTVEGLESPTGLRAADLASTLKTMARHVRKYLILDCCFAAAAFTEFQSGGGVAQLAGEQIAEELPPKGTALLCAASKSAPAIAPAAGTYTMFSGGLRAVLFNGSKTGRLHMSLNEIGKEIKLLLRESSPDDWVRPQVLSPDAAEGDVAEVALFPNPAVSTTELRHLLSALTDRVSILEEETQTTAKTIAEQGTLSNSINQRVSIIETQAKAVDQRIAELQAASQSTGQNLKNLELQGQTITQQIGTMEAAANKMAATIKKVQSQVEHLPRPEQTPAAIAQPAVTVISPPGTPPKRIEMKIVNPIAAIHLCWGLAIAFFLFAIPNLDFLGRNFVQFQIGSMLVRHYANGTEDVAFQFGRGDFTSSLLLFTISVIVLPVLLFFVSPKTRWRDAATLAVWWVSACIIALFGASFVGNGGGRELTYDASDTSGYAKWLFWGATAALVYGLLQGALFSLLAAFYRVISLRGVLVACAFLAFTSTSIWVLSLIDVWLPRFWLIALVSSAASAIILANLSDAIQQLRAIDPKSKALSKLV